MFQRKTVLIYLVLLWATFVQDVYGKEHGAKLKQKVAKHEANKSRGRKVDPTGESINIVTVNQLADLILNRTRPVMEKYQLNPLKMPDQSESVLMIRLELKNILVYNLQSIKRRADVILVDYPDKQLIVLDLKFTFDDLVIKSDYKVSAVAVRLPQSTVTATITGIAVNVQLLIDTANINATLDYIKLKMPEDNIKLRFDGKLTGAIMNPLSSAAATAFRRVILAIIEGPIQDRTNDILKYLSKMARYILENINSGTLY